MLTKTSIAKTDWAAKHFNSEVDYARLNQEPIAVVAAVSRERGVELVMQFKKSVNVPKYKAFLDELRRLNPFDNLCLIQDRLRVHLNQYVLERMTELGFRWSYTPRYSP